MPQGYPTPNPSRVVEHYLKSRSARKTAREFGISLQTVLNIVRRHNAPVQPWGTNKATMQRASA